MDFNGSSVTSEPRAVAGDRISYVRAAMDFDLAHAQQAGPWDENRSMTSACSSRKAGQGFLSVKDSHVQTLKKRFHRIIFKAKHNILFDQGGTCDKVLEARIDIQRKKDSQRKRDLQRKRAAAREAMEKIVKTVYSNDQDNIEEEFLKLLCWKPPSEQKETELEDGEIVAD